MNRSVSIGIDAFNNDLRDSFHRSPLRCGVLSLHAQDQPFRRPSLGKTPSELQALCADLARLGPPTYFSKNLILHGVAVCSLPKPLENALDAQFDVAVTWTALQDT